MPSISSALVAAAQSFGIDPAFVYAAANRGPGGSLNIPAARTAVEQMSPLAASIEVPSLSYQETMILIESLFVAGYEEMPALTSMFCNRVTKSARTIDYHGLGAAPRMRERLDESQGEVLNTLPPFQVTVRDWEATVEIPVSYLQADQLGEYSMKMQEMGAFAKQHPDELIAALIVAADATLCYDGQYLCDTDHDEASSGTQSNLLTTGGDDDDIADVETDLGTAIAAMQRFKDDRGNDMRMATNSNAVWDLVCRPEVFGVFNKLATATQISGTDNGWKGRLRVTTLPELTTADEWYLVYAGGVRKPFTVQYQKEPSALVILGKDSEHATKTGRALFTTKGNYTVAPADWRCIIKIQKS
jgi:phage major head subunit gpT-like protein